MKRKVLLSSHTYECVKCGDSMFSVKMRNDAGEPLCLLCALSCDWCEERKDGVSVISHAYGHRQIICGECATLRNEVNQ